MVPMLTLVSGLKHLLCERSAFHLIFYYCKRSNNNDQSEGIRVKNYIPMFHIHYVFVIKSNFGLCGCRKIHLKLE